MKKSHIQFHLKILKSKFIYSAGDGPKKVDRFFFRTQFTQQAAITVGSFLSRWESLIEDFSIKRFQQNAQVGREGFLNVLERFVVMAEAQQPTN